jgi:hypothetical protein
MCLPVRLAGYAAENLNSPGMFPESPKNTGAGSLQTAPAAIQNQWLTTLNTDVLVFYPKKHKTH